jgi:Spy/CpxP family protein refolding chaperone
MEAAIATHANQQPVDDLKLRDAQRARLRQLHDELVAEGADGSKHLPELQRRADAWPE